jgi:hypothetical protein
MAQQGRRMNAHKIFFISLSSAIELAGRTYLFKVDYYAPDMEGGSEDPADPTKTTRVLTIIRADE